MRFPDFDSVCSMFLVSCSEKFSFAACIIFQNKQIRALSEFLKCRGVEEFTSIQ